MALTLGYEHFARLSTDSSGNVSLVGTDGIALHGSCTIVQAYNTQTTITTGTATGALTEYVKILLDTALVDTHGAADLVNSSIIVPSWAKFVRVAGHISFPDQNIAAGHASGHLWRNVQGSSFLTAAGAIYYTSPTNADKPTPEAHYHNRIYYPATAKTGGTAYYSVLAATGWIPVMATGEIWTLYAWQDTTASVVTPGGVENWLTVDFSRGV